MKVKKLPGPIRVGVDGNVGMGAVGTTGLAIALDSSFMFITMQQ